MDKVELLRKVSLFADLSDEQLEALAENTHRRTFAKDMIIFHKDSPGESLYLIESGRVRIFVLSESGQEISVNIYGPGEVFGELSLLDGLPRSAGAMALEDTVTLALHRDDFTRLLEANPQMATSILKVLSSRVRYTTAYAESLAFLDVYGRVAAKLLELAERYGVESDGIEIQLRLTQSELATWVGATRESVNKVLGTFRELGLIDIANQRITILDKPGLRRRITY